MQALQCKHESQVSRARATRALSFPPEGLLGPPIARRLHATAKDSKKLDALQAHPALVSMLCVGLVIGGSLQAKVTLPSATIVDPHRPFSQI
jgi:hypothetical protein